MNTITLFKLFCIIMLTLMSVSGCKNSPSDTKTKSSMPVFPGADKPATLATISETQSSATIIRDVLFAGNGGNVVYTVEKNGLSYVVHNNRSGSLYKAIGSVVLSPDGSRIAYGAVVEDKYRMVLDVVEGELFRQVGDQLFSPDGRHMLYQALKDDVWHLVVDTTVNKGSKTHYNTPQFSGDSASIIYLDNIDKTTDMGRLVVCDIKFSKERVIDSSVASFGLNADKSVVAAISRSKANRQRIIQFNFDKPEAVTMGAEYDKILSVKFAPSGTDLVYFGERQGKIYGVFNGQEEVLPENLMPVTSVINQVGKYVGVLMTSSNTVFLYRMFRNSGRVGNAYDEAEWLVYSSDGAMSAFAARKGNKWFVVVNGVEGPAFDRVVTPKFSPGGKYLVYRARKEGKRFVVVADAKGKTIKQHPSYEQVFQPVFTADGKSVAYGVKDGNKLIWKVEKLGE